MNNVQSVTIVHPSQPRTRAQVGFLRLGVLCAGLGVGLSARAQDAVEAADAVPPAAPSAALEEARQAEEPFASDFRRELDAQLGVSGGLTARGVSERAVVASHALRASGEQVRVADARLSELRRQYLPRLSVSLAYTYRSPIEQEPLAPGNVVGTTEPVGPLPAGTTLIVSPAPVLPDYEHHTGLQASLIVPLSDYALRLPAHQASMTENLNGAAHARQATLHATHAQAQLAYYRWAFSKLQVLVAKHATYLAQQHEAEVNKAFLAGKAPNGDVLIAKSRVTRSALFEREALDTERSSADTLGTIMQDTSSRLYQIGEALQSDAGLSEETASADEHYRNALLRRPELRATKAFALAYEQQAKATRADYLPRLDLVGNVYYSQPNPRFVPQQNRLDATWDAGARLTWNLSDALVGGARVEQSSGLASRTHSELKILEDAIRNEVLDAHQRLLRSRQARQSAESALASAEEQWRVRRVQFLAGRATSRAVTDAEVALTEARLDVISARIGRSVALVELRRATGVDIEAR